MEIPKHPRPLRQLVALWKLAVGPHCQGQNPHNLLSMAAEPTKLWRRGGRKNVRATGNGEHQENKSLQINYGSLIGTHKDWSSKHGAYTGMNQVLCIYIIVFSLVFSWDTWVCEWACLWFECLLLGLFSFCWTYCMRMDSIYNKMKRIKHFPSLWCYQK